jgi:hypothetical protein
MKSIAVVGILLAGLSLSAGGAETNTTRFYIQLVRVTEGPRAPTRDAREIGPKLREELAPMPKSKTFWETDRREVVVVPGSPAKVALGRERIVQIDLSEDKRTVKTYYLGRPAGCAASPRGAGMTVIGESRATGNPCFIVVRKDKPAI